MNNSSNKVPAKHIYAYALPGAPENLSSWLRPCRPKRDWMDRTPAAYASRCIPLSAANTMGWEILNPVACEFRWSGLTPQQEVIVYRDTEDRWGPKSHFGTGTVTWELPFLFRTSADYGLVVTGPANHDKADITPLDGFIRSDWLPFPFTMNWRLTRADTTVRFEAGEPIARIYPYPLGLLEDAQLEIHNLDEDPEFKQKFMEWGRERQRNYRQRGNVEASLASGEATKQDSMWNRQYARGKGSDDSSNEHQTVFKCKHALDSRDQSEDS